MSERPTVLFVDDERPVLNSLERHLVRESYRQLFTTSPREGLEILAREPVQVVVADMRMPEMEGLDFLKEVRARHPEVIRIVLSGTSEFHRVVGAINSGEIFRYVTKPIAEMAEFRAILRQAFELYALHRSRVELLAQLEDTNRHLSRWRDRVSRDLEVAGRVQKGMLSATPLLSDACEVWWAYRPSMSVGGDFFDAVSMPDGRVCVYVGDVSGHGVGPAMLSTLMKVVTTDMIRDDPAAGASELCRRLNRFACSHLPGDEFFVTFFIAVLDPVAGRWTACNCGHPKPFLLGPNGAWLGDRIPDAGEMPLGINPKAAFGKEAEMSWAATPGEMLMLFTDGLYEARRGDGGEQCGAERLQEVAQALAAPGQPYPHPGDLLARLAAEGFELADDDCCAAMIRLPVPGETLLRQAFPAGMEAVERFADGCAERLRAAGWDDGAAKVVRAVASDYGETVVRQGNSSPAVAIEASLYLRGGSACLSFRDTGAPRDGSRFPAVAGKEAGDGAESGTCVGERARVIRREVFRRDGYNCGYFVVSPGA